MAKGKQTLAKFEAVALSREQAQQIKGGYKVSALPLTQPALGFIGWGEVEIRGRSFRIVSMPTRADVPRL